MQIKDKLYGNYVIKSIKYLCSTNLETSLS